MENMLPVIGIGDIFPRTTIFSKDNIFFRVLDFFLKIIFLFENSRKRLRGTWQIFYLKKRTLAKNH
jgi:hypothetical protein